MFAYAHGVLCCPIFMQTLVPDQALAVMGMGQGDPYDIANYGVASDQLL